MIFAVLCTGPSLSPAVVDRVRHLPLVAVNNAYELAPFAVALAANDVKWWARNPDAHQFDGRKFSTNRIRGVEHVMAPHVQNRTCSGVLGMEVAKRLGATRILLLGADFHGSHYFGAYENGLTNTDEKGRRIHANQFASWARVNKRVMVVNATEGSMLECFPRVSLDECLS